MVCTVCSGKTVPFIPSSPAKQPPARSPGGGGGGNRGGGGIVAEQAAKIAKLEAQLAAKDKAAPAVPPAGGPAHDTTAPRDYHVIQAELDAIAGDDSDPEVASTRKAKEDELLAARRGRLVALDTEIAQLRKLATGLLSSDDCKSVLDKRQAEHEAIRSALHAVKPLGQRVNIARERTAKARKALDERKAEAVASHAALVAAQTAHAEADAATTAAQAALQQAEADEAALLRKQADEKAGGPDDGDGTSQATPAIDLQSVSQLLAKFDSLVEAVQASDGSPPEIKAAATELRTHAARLRQGSPPAGDGSTAPSEVAEDMDVSPSDFFDSPADFEEWKAGGCKGKLNLKKVKQGLAKRPRSTTAAAVALATSGRK